MKDPIKGQAMICKIQVNIWSYSFVTYEVQYRFWRLELGS